ncbi:hypothetical protein [Bradyrhizobium sp.]|uniref:hypothetical protein n=1 Tax=Bradyrhizobium sp. TaxID=376 RepID=UPI0026329705|nr:hypothetical protein [Bradyrhizobium sp.]
MNDLFDWVLSLPSFAIVGIIGAIAGGTGALLGAAAQKVFGQNKAWRIIPVIFVVGSIQLTTKSLLPSLQQDAAVRVMMKQSPIFSVILKYHPDAEAETVRKLNEIRGSPNSGLAARAVGAAIADKYVNLHMLVASDEAVRNLLLSEVAIVRSARSQPSDCVALYLGTANAPVDKVPLDLLNAKAKARADIIETAVTQPAPLPSGLSVDALGKILARSYQSNGFNIGEISKLEDVGSLPAKEGCDIAYHFLTAMASLAPKEAATVYKGLLALNK